MHEAILKAPDLPRLALDLVEVEGGDSYPTRFYGRAADGSAISIRYRMGWLSIKRDTPEHPHMGPDAETLLEARIGPAFHGEILLEQVSELTGIKVRGEQLHLPEQAFREKFGQHRLVDFSGRRRDVDYLAWGRDEDLAGLVRAIMRDLPVAGFLQAHFANGAGIEFRPASGPAEDMAERQFVLIGGEPAAIPELARARDILSLEDAFDLVLTVGRSGPRHSPRFPKRPVGDYQDVEITPGRQMRLGTANGDHCFIHGQFEVARPRSLALAEAVLTLADQIFPRGTRQIDLVTGETVRLSPQRVGSSVADWCRAADDRYLYLNLHGPHAGTGTRPAEGDDVKPGDP